MCRYIDRICVDPVLRSRGLGTRLYAEAQQLAKERHVPLLCEVNTRPPNERSLAWHTRLGFKPVGKQATEGGHKEVVYLQWTPLT